MSFTESKQNLQYLTTQRHTLSTLGIDLNVMKGKDLLKHYWKFFLILIVIIYLQYGLMNFVVDSVENIDVATGPLSVMNQCCLVVFKISIFLYKGDDFLKLISRINELAENANPKEYKKWQSENQRSNLTTKMYFYACSTAVGCACFIPIFLMAYEHYIDVAIVKKLPFGGRFPYDNDTILCFVINYMLSVAYICSLLNMTVSVDGLFGWYIHSISAHFQMLRIKVEHVASKIAKDDHEDFTANVGVIVAYHNAILEIAESFNYIFSEIFSMEVILSCLQMCFVFNTLNNEADPTNMPFNVMAFVALFIQLTIYCFGGEKLRNESDLVCNDIYLQFPWHKMTPQEKKLMLLPLMRSQRESSLKGLVFEADRNLLVYILKTAFSFHALLSNIKENK